MPPLIRSRTNYKQPWVAEFAYPPSQDHNIMMAKGLHEIDSFDHDFDGIKRVHKRVKMTRDRVADWAGEIRGV